MGKGSELQLIAYASMWGAFSCDFTVIAEITKTYGMIFRKVSAGMHSDALALPLLFDLRVSHAGV